MLGLRAVVHSIVPLALLEAVRNLDTPVEDGLSEFAEELLSRGGKSPQQEIIFASSSDARKFLLCSSVYGRDVDVLVTLLRRAPQAALPAVLAALSVHVTCEERAQRR